MTTPGTLPPEDEAFLSRLLAHGIDAQTVAGIREALENLHAERWRVDADEFERLRAFALRGALQISLAWITEMLAALADDKSADFAAGCRFAAAIRDELEELGGRVL